MFYLAKDGAALRNLFGGGTNKRKQADINRAKALYLEYKTRKKIGLAAEKMATKVIKKKR